MLEERPNKTFKTTAKQASESPSSPLTLACDVYSMYNLNPSGMRFRGQTGDSGGDGMRCFFFAGALETMENLAAAKWIMG